MLLNMQCLQNSAGSGKRKCTTENGSELGCMKLKKLNLPPNAWVAPASDITLFLNTDCTQHDITPANTVENCIAAHEINLKDIILQC